MALTRIVDTDDDGTGTTGTIHNNAWLQTINDSVDGRWSELTTTTTGSNNNFSITSGGIEADRLRCNNASLLTLTGIVAPASPAKPGKLLILYSVGAGNVDLANESGSSTAANRIITSTGGTISLAAGSGGVLLNYDATASRWRVIAAPVAQNLKFPATQIASTDANTLDDYEEGTFTPVVASSGGGTATYTTQVGHYLKVGRIVHAVVYVVLATKGTLAAGNVTITGLPFTTPNTTGLNHHADAYFASMTTNIVKMFGIIVPNTSVFVIQHVAAAAASPTATTVADVSATWAVGITTSYLASA